MTSTASALSSRYGLDRWLTINAVDFSIWDQWFLIFLFGEHDGAWSALRDRLRLKARGVGSERDDAEAKLNHLGDLERRWLALDVAAREQLRCQCQDRHLLRRARSKIVEQFVRHREKTVPMRETPRVRLHARALRGHWARFPTSPAPYEAVFTEMIAARDFYDERASFGLARHLETLLDRQIERARSAGQRLAISRAFLTAMIETMECADDSCGVIGDLCQERFGDYVGAPWRDAGLGPALYYRDFLEFAVWEDYGLLTRNLLDVLFRAVAKEEFALVDEVLRGIRGELCAADLEYQAERALTLLGQLYVVKRRFKTFEALAAEMGSRTWERITTMVEVAMRAHRPDVARGVVAAADQPGPHRDALRERCGRLLGVNQPRARRRGLAVVRSR